ncbi:MAG: PQQ-like beta-propeller repeat protein, partial [Planctomycetaceae bacterium]|nr:PQQ-like beta-propeller repeat protein [Planctomycetaceae bacterium]
MRTRYFLMMVLVIVATSLPLCAEDWSQWLGNQRDSVWRETGIIDEFPESGPVIKWRTPVGLGYSGPAVVGDRVYLFDYRLDSGDVKPNPSSRNRLVGQERVVCLNASTGEQVWEHKYDCPYYISYPSGPRCTPTVHDGLVYTLGAEGHLSCLNAKTGKPLWQKNLKQLYGIDESPIWGYASHPLIVDDLVITLAGGEGSVAVAFHRKTGQEAWKNLTASEPGYAPPTMLEWEGTRQLLIWHADAINSLNPADGSVYWAQPLKPQYGMSIMAPRVAGNLLYAAGIGDVGTCFELSVDAQGKPAADIKWTGTGRTGIYPANSAPFIEDGIIYGCNIRPGTFMAVDLNSGERLWETTELITGERPAPHATAFIVKQQDRFFLLTEKGDLVMTRLTSGGFREISRAHVIEPTGDAFGRPVVWSHPAFANRCCYARNDQEIICIDL